MELIFAVRGHAGLLRSDRRRRVWGRCCGDAYQLVHREGRNPYPPGHGIWVTPENAAFLFINHRPAQLATVRAMDHTLLFKNAVSTVKTIKTFGILVMHSTVNVFGLGIG
jgi:hypothetical protein